MEILKRTNQSLRWNISPWNNTCFRSI